MPSWPMITRYRFRFRSSSTTSPACTFSATNVLSNNEDPRHDGGPPGGAEPDVARRCHQIDFAAAGAAQRLPAGDVIHLTGLQGPEDGAQRRLAKPLAPRRRTFRRSCGTVGPADCRKRPTFLMLMILCNIVYTDALVATRVPLRLCYQRSPDDLSRAAILDKSCTDPILERKRSIRSAGRELRRPRITVAFGDVDQLASILRGFAVPLPDFVCGELRRDSEENVLVAGDVALEQGADVS